MGIINQKEYDKLYYLKHKKRRKKQTKKYRKDNSKKIKLKVLKHRKENPWYGSYHDAKQRCNNPNNSRYKYYGGRGIKFLMNMEEIKRIWFRDKAYKMKIPTIDRIDNDGNYCLDNCRFIEKSENTIKSNRERMIKRR